MELHDVSVYFPTVFRDTGVPLLPQRCPDIHPSLRQHLKLSATKKFACGGGGVRFPSPGYEHKLSFYPSSVLCAVKPVGDSKIELKCCCDKRICISWVAPHKSTPLRTSIDYCRTIRSCRDQRSTSVSHSMSLSSLSLTRLQSEGTQRS